MYICKTCGKNFTVKKTFLENESILCNGCKRKETYNLHPELSEKRVKTYKENSIQKYGIDDPNKTSLVREKVRSSLVATFEERKDEILEKRVSTTQERYGVQHIMQDPEIKAKCFQSQIDNGGIGWQREELQKSSQKLAHSEEAEKKRKDTCLNKYGVVHHFKDKDILSRQWASYEEKTGFNHPAHNPEIIHSAKGYLYEEIHFDSSWELAYYIWLKDNGKKFIYHPAFFMDYIDDKGEKRMYQPDFLVEGKFIEIKGDQFFNEKGEPYCRYTKSFWWGKYNALKENKVQILKIEDVKEYLRYVKEKYGKNFLKTFKTR